MKVFFNFSRGRSELWIISMGSYEELFKKSFQGKKCLKFFNVFLRFPMFSNVFQCYLLSFSLSLTLSLFLTLTLFQSLIQSLSTCWTTFVFISMLKSRCLLQKWQCFFFTSMGFFLQNFITDENLERFFLVGIV